MTRSRNDAESTDLPVEPPVQLEILINPRTIRALGASILQSPPFRAEEVIP